MNRKFLCLTVWLNQGTITYKNGLCFMAWKLFFVNVLVFDVTVRARKLDASAYCNYIALWVSILNSMCASKVLAEAISIQSKCYLHQTCGAGMEYQKGQIWNLAILWVWDGPHRAQCHIYKGRDILEIIFWSNCSSPSVKPISLYWQFLGHSPPLTTPFHQTNNL